MPEIEDSLEYFDQTTDEFDTTDKVIESNAANGDLDPDTVLQTTDSTYNFEQTTVIIALQILPATAQLERQVILSAGIKGSLPIISSTTLAQIEQVEVIVDLLEKLKQILPQLALQAKLREEKQRTQSQTNSRKQVVPTPELPQQSSAAKLPSSQLTLF